jgi:hypothetical protein
MYRKELLLKEMIQKSTSAGSYTLNQQFQNQNMLYKTGFSFWLYIVYCAYGECLMVY